MVVFLLRFDLSHDKARRHSGCRRARSFRVGRYPACLSTTDFVRTLTSWLVSETVICSLTLAGRGVARVVRGSWFGYLIARRVLCRSHVQSLICAWAAVVGHERPSDRFHCLVVLQHPFYEVAWASFLVYHAVDGFGLGLEPFVRSVDF